MAEVNLSSAIFAVRKKEGGSVSINLFSPEGVPLQEVPLEKSRSIYFRPRWQLKSPVFSITHSYPGSASDHN